MGWAVCLRVLVDVVQMAILAPRGTAQQLAIFSKAFQEGLGQDLIEEGKTQKTGTK